MNSRCAFAFLLILDSFCCSGQAQSLDSIRMNGYVQAAAVSPDARYIAVVTLNSSQQADGSWANAESVQVLEPGTGKIVSSKALEHGALVRTGPLDPSSAFIGYCDEGKYLLAYDGNGEVDVFDPSSFALTSQIDLNRQSGFSPDVHVKIACSSASDSVAISLQGGRAGTGLVRVVEIPSGKDVATWNEDRPSDEIKALSISQDGTEVALLLGNTQWPLRAPVGPNIEIRDTRHSGMLSQFSTGDASSGLRFVGNSAIATLQGSSGGRFSGKRGIVIWNAETGKEAMRLVDAHADVYGSIASSADGQFILGYIPEIHGCAFCNGLEGRVEVKKQQFAVWNATTGKQVFRSESFGPVVRPFQPECTLSAKGNVVMVYWPSTQTTPRLIPWTADIRK
jgi:WD40 repeat protein